MQNLITKLSQNDYNQQFCQKEVIAMRDANTASYHQFLKEKEENRAGHIKPGPHLNPVPLNKYLKRFPIEKPNPYEQTITDIPAWKRKYCWYFSLCIELCVTESLEKKKQSNSAR